MRSMPSRHCASTWALLAVTLAAVACGKRDAPSDAKPDAVNGAARSSPTAPVVQAQIVPSDPCGWISQADAEKALGEPLLRAPIRVRSAETPRAAPDGSACRYDLKSSGPLERNVAIELQPDESGVMQAAFMSLGRVEKELQGSEANGDTLLDGRWDFVSAIPGGLTAAKTGRIGVLMITSLDVTRQGMALAGAIVDRIPDLPFAIDPADPAIRPEGPDPCGLITRAEAEAVLGPLVVAPYRSRKSSALVYGSGPSCAYFTGKHRAIVVTPRWRNGPNMFQMLGSVSAVVAGTLGDTAAPETIEGNWDQLATGQDGTLHVLKGEKMLSVRSKASAASYANAVQLARAALARF